MFGAIVNGLGSVLGFVGQNANISKQIKVQQQENQKNREYNMMLAQQQNAWNVEQWERENEYNTPVNQMSRLKAAGINPNLAYSNGVSNLAAASPDMTSGAPSSPVDMSPLGQRATLGQAIQMALTNEAVRADIDNVKANTRKTLADAGISETQLSYEDAKQKLGIQISQQLYDNMKEEFNNLFELGRKYALENESIPYETLSKKLDAEFKEKSAQILLDDLKLKLKISEKEAEYLTKTLASRILGVEIDTQLKEYEKNLNSPELIKALPEGIKPLVSLLNLIFRGR